MKNEQLLNKSIYELAEEHGWSRQVRDAMICYVHNCWGVQRHRPIAEQREARANLDKLEKETTLKDVLNSLEKDYIDCSGWRSKYLAYLQKFIKLGLTRLDSIVMPQKTITVEMLKRIPRDELLKMDARILGTVTTMTLENYRSYIEDKENRRKSELSPFPTVKQLLESPPHWYMSQKTLKATRQLFEELGFGYEDGLFMQAGSRRKFIEDLMEEENISESEAKLVAEIALKRGWVNLKSTCR